MKKKKVSKTKSSSNKKVSGKKSKDEILKELLKDVIVTVVGKQAEEIADLLYSKNHVNEFLIAKKLDITINQARNILYKISDYGLVSSIRKKDKRKGWYTYFWKIEVLKALEFLKGILLKKINQLEHQIHSRETKIFYQCKNCNIEFSEENALLRNFTCNECGRIFTQKDNAKVLRLFRRNLNSLRNSLKITEEEIAKEVEKQEKIKQRQLKKESKKRAEKRRRTRRKNAKKKLKKKVAKKGKSSKKKTSKKRIGKKRPNKKKTLRKKVVKKKRPKRKKRRSSKKKIKNRLGKKSKKKKK